MIAPGKVRVATVNAAFADRLKALAFTRLERTVTVVVQRYELTVDVLNMTDTGRMDFNALLKGVVRV